MGVFSGDSVPSSGGAAQREERVLEKELGRGQFWSLRAELIAKEIGFMLMLSHTLESPLHSTARLSANQCHDTLQWGK